jgi:diguanylate cyclase (GGDEF)-like protein
MDNLTSPISTRHKPSKLFIFINISTVIVITVLLSYILWYGYNVRIQEAKNNTRYIANLYASQTSDNILGVEKMLSSLGNTILSPNFKMGSSHTSNYLLKIQSNYEYLMDILIIDPAGNIIKWTGKGKLPDVSDREYVTAHINNLEFASFIGEPLLSMVHKGEWFFPVSIPIKSNSGTLQYIAVAIIDIIHFQSNMQTTELPQGGTLGLVTNSGKVITRLPEHNKFVGVQIKLPNDMTAHQDSGNIEIISPFDQVNRITGYSLISEYDIIAFSTIPKKQVLAQWYYYLIYSSLLLLSIIFSLGLSTRQLLINNKKIEEQSKQLFFLANTDELTGLINRRQLYVLINREVTRSNRYQRELSFIMFDIDFFKNINDTYGHEIGDLALKHISSILVSHCRNEDSACRYGGEEFLVMLPETGIEEASEMAERIRNQFEETVLMHGEISIKITASFGVSNYQQDKNNNSVHMAIKLADDAMYDAKESGRNRVCISK